MKEACHCLDWVVKPRTQHQACFPCARPAGGHHVGQLCRARGPRAGARLHAGGERQGAGGVVRGEDAAHTSNELLQVRTVTVVSGVAGAGVGGLPAVVTTQWPSLCRSDTTVVLTTVVASAFKVAEKSRTLIHKHGANLPAKPDYQCLLGYYQYFSCRGRILLSTSDSRARRHACPVECLHPKLLGTCLPSNSSLHAKPSTRVCRCTAAARHLCCATCRTRTIDRLCL